MPSQAYVVESLVGLMALTEDGYVISTKSFPKERELVSERMLSLERGELVPELKELIEELINKNVSEVVVENEELARTLSKKYSQLRILHELPSKGGLIFRSRLKDYIEKLGMNWEEYLDLLHDVSVLVTKKKVKEAAEKRDLFVAQAISAIDEIDKTINLFASRLREWYGLHFPELNDLVRDHRDFVKIVHILGPRSELVRDKLLEIGIPAPKAKRIEKSARGSMGATVTDFDMSAIRQIAELLTQLYEARKKLETYVDEAMKEVAPNIRGLVGSLLGARLIALAGGLQKLAVLPASTIQVLGAEKALFRALRTGGRPPKHGLIFQYPAIFKAPRWQRGKIARALAAKLAIAARIDAFTGEYKVDEIKEELQKRIEEIRKLYSKPPKRVEKPRKRRRRR